MEEGTEQANRKKDNGKSGKPKKKAPSSNKKGIKNRKTKGSPKGTRGCKGLKPKEQGYSWREE